jgi:hypothetical protein
MYLRRIVDKIFNSVLSSNAAVDVRNETDEEIFVEMNNNREIHAIAPHGQATFSTPNIGDMPVFSLHKKQGGPVVSSKKIGHPIGTHSSLTWNGSSLA